MRRRKFKKKRLKHNKPNLANNKRKRMLNMHSVRIFNYDLKDLLSKLPEETDRGPLFASIFSKASNIGIDEAEEFVKAKTEEGIIPKSLSNELNALLNRHSRYR